METTLVAQEFRTLKVWTNLAKELRNRSSRRRGAALAAFARWLLLRGPLAATLATGGILTLILALQANSLLREQNSLIEQETTLAELQIYQLEIERVERYRQRLFDLIDRLGTVKEPCDWADRRAYCIDHGTATDLAWLSERLVPYYDVVPAEQEGALPSLSDRPLSRERGLILEALSREKIVNVTSQLLDVTWTSRLTFESAYLPSSTLSGMDLTSANLTSAQLAGSEMENIFALNARLDSADLAEADLQYSQLWNTSLERSNLRKANLAGAMLQDANLTLANLREAHLEGADLSGASILLADLRNAQFKTAQVSDSQLRSACLDQGTLQANDRNDLASNFQPPANCNEIWGSQEAVEWLRFSDHPPALGQLVMAGGVLPNGDEMFEFGRWDGEKIVSSDGSRTFPQSAQLRSWRTVVMINGLIRDERPFTFRSAGSGGNEHD